MSANISKPSGNSVGAHVALDSSDGFAVSALKIVLASGLDVIAAGSPSEFVASLSPEIATTTTTLADLRVGARLIIRCRADWREAFVTEIEPERITLRVFSPRGRSYKVRRPFDSAITFNGAIPLLGDKGSWRESLARYDSRW